MAVTKNDGIKWSLVKSRALHGNPRLESIAQKFVSKSTYQTHVKSMNPNHLFAVGSRSLSEECESLEMIFREWATRQIAQDVKQLTEGQVLRTILSHAE